MRRPCLQSRSYLERSQNHYTINDFFRPEVTGGWDIPVMQRCDMIPRIDLYPYDKKKQYPSNAVFGQYALHFFMDDAIFQKLWLQPQRTLAPIQRIGLAITPDFSLYRDWSLAVQIWQTYRTRWLGAYWAANNVEVIPSVSWSDERSFDFCFDGLPVGGTFAIATMEVAEPEAKPFFADGFNEFLRRCNPDTLLVYGQLFKDIIEPGCKKYDCEVRRYKSRIHAIKWKLNEKRVKDTLNASNASKQQGKQKQTVGAL
jgi:hypothetical protein